MDDDRAWPSAVRPASSRLLRADLDHDGYTDLVHAPTGREPAVQWGGSRGVSAAQRLTGATGGIEATGDFDGDGTADLYFGGDTATAGAVWDGPAERGGAPARRQELAAGDDSDVESDGGEDADRVRGRQYLRGGAGDLNHSWHRAGESTPLEGLSGDVDGDDIDDLCAPGFSPGHQLLAEHPIRPGDRHTRRDALRQVPVRGPKWRCHR